MSLLPPAAEFEQLLRERIRSFEPKTRAKYGDDPSTPETKIKGSKFSGANGAGRVGAGANSGKEGRIPGKKRRANGKGSQYRKNPGKKKVSDKGVPLRTAGSLKGVP